MVYTALEDDQIPVYLEAFYKEHPEMEGKVHIVRDSTGIMTAKLLAEKDNPQADLVWGTAATSLLVAKQQGMLEPYSPAGLDRILKGFRDPAEVPSWVGIDAWMTGIVVNTIETEAKGLPHPKSYKDLLDPVYAGSLVMPNPASSGTGFLTVSAILQLMGEDAGWKYLDDLHKNIAVYTHSGSQPAKLAGAGEYPIGISFFYRGVKQKKSGQPVVTYSPAESSGFDVEANALIKKDGIKPEARMFLDWAISDSAMEQYAKSYPITAVKNMWGIPDGFPQNPTALIIDNDFEWAASNRQRILEEWTRRYDSKSLPKN
ncbi:putative 2-aminoethylphosphonate ABC transporter substrate-binding protein [Sediminispirochaeta bajacaliforniensis]|uniref:putative 2-aminoethylphosphonate ABC transporter substrate-binding protein n=1 Tax=Sediminispirochaeta bajacaliforniensis TaxID=148 RepID=UPI0012B5844D|nr:putative 2-aminoethylphosphonate ABC transporter substrate-binding protein [Sediminispirochaeta bajacaliforniensis]